MKLKNCGHDIPKIPLSPVILVYFYLALGIFLTLALAPKFVFLLFSTPPPNTEFSTKDSILTNMAFEEFGEPCCWGTCMWKCNKFKEAHNLSNFTCACPRDD